MRWINSIIYRWRVTLAIWRGRGEGGTDILLMVRPVTPRLGMLCLSAHACLSAYACQAARLTVFCCCSVPPSVVLRCCVSWRLYSYVPRLVCWCVRRCMMVLPGRSWDIHGPCPPLPTVRGYSKSNYMHGNTVLFLCFFCFLRTFSLHTFCFISFRVFVVVCFGLFFRQP